MLDLLQLIDLSCLILVKSHNLIPRSLLNEAEDNIGVLTIYMEKPGIQFGKLQKIWVVI